MATHSASARHGRSLSSDGRFFSRHGYLRAPRLVQWFATLRCGLGCEHCLARCGEPAAADMPLDTALCLIDQAADMGTEEFLITGGEPLLREDLPEIVERLGQRELPYSVNTAILPSATLQRAFAKHPPIFVAVSVDGPAEIHDAFRHRAGAFDEAMESLRFFASLDGCETAAGTTVTARNIDALPQTFGLVSQSDADRWGIHLLVPEGRAAERKDLFLSRSQLRWLIDFVARRRVYFPITMADEIGYCGEMEPLLRDAPFQCGAGRAQCVVLSSGEVVPCTTLDESTSAGNVNARPLADIWRDGFADLRAWKAQGKCGWCEYAAACAGGCWLQRRAGQHCFKDVWHRRGLAKSTAGLALCLGMLGGAATAGAQARMSVPGDDGAARPVMPARAVGYPSFDVLPSPLDGYIAVWYAREIGDQRSPNIAPADDLANDPAYQFFAAMCDGKLPGDIVGLSKSISDSLTTKQHSLGHIALTWRALSEWCLAHPQEKRTAGERKLLRQTMQNIQTSALTVRQQVFEVKLAAFLAGRDPFGRFMMGKAGPPQWLSREYRAEQKRWPGVFGQAGDAILIRAERPAPVNAKEALEKLPYASGMQLAIASDAPVTVNHVPKPATGPTSQAYRDRIASLVKDLDDDDFKVRERATAALIGIGPDVVPILRERLPSGTAELRERAKTILAGIVAQWPGPMGIFDIITAPADAAAKITVKWPVDAQGAQSYTVELPAGAELTYVDLLKMTWQQNANAPQLKVPAQVQLGNPLLLPAVLERQSDPNATDQMKAMCRQWLVDFWMF